MNRGIRVLQTLALPLGYVTIGDIYIICELLQKVHTYFWKTIPTLSCGHCLWSGQRGSNSLPPPWQGGALPDELHLRINSPAYAADSRLMRGKRKISRGDANGHPPEIGASGRNRTNDTRIFSPLLYQLSYRGKCGRCRPWRRGRDLNPRPPA